MTEDIIRDHQKNLRKLGGEAFMMTNDTQYFTFLTTPNWKPF